MKLNTTALVIGVALVVVAGLFGSTIFGITGIKNNAQSTAAAAGLITGHVVTTLTDPDGNIKAYRQSDNIIVNNGENCVAKMLFGAAGGDTVSTGVCTGEISDGFRYIGIGNYTTNVNGTNTSLGNEYSAAKGVPSLARGVATVIMTNSTGATGSFASVQLTKTFTSSQSNPQTVTESGLFNNTSIASGAMFSRQTFSPITMNNGDSLTVQWTISIGGTTGSLLNP
ncbi:MAG: hypothetical protein QW177_02380 [Candidatus Nitrosotenuis sp.]